MFTDRFPSEEISLPGEVEKMVFESRQHAINTYRKQIRELDEQIKQTTNEERKIRLLKERAVIKTTLEFNERELYKEQHKTMEVL